MPSYFFHLLFELYPPPSGGGGGGVGESGYEYVIPREGFDLFGAGAVEALRRERRGVEGEVGEVERDGEREGEGQKRHRHVDFRFGRVSVESIDFGGAGGGSGGDGGGGGEVALRTANGGDGGGGGGVGGSEVLEARVGGGGAGGGSTSTKTTTTTTTSNTSTTTTTTTTTTVTGAAGRNKNHKIKQKAGNATATATTHERAMGFGVGKHPITNNLLKSPPPAPPPSSTARSSSQATTSQQPKKHGQAGIPSIENTTTSAINNAKPQEEQSGQRRVSGVSSSAPPKARFIPLHSETTEFGYGVVHLYRDGEETQGLYPLPEAYVPVQAELSGKGGSVWDAGGAGGGGGGAMPSSSGTAAMSMRHSKALGGKDESGDGSGSGNICSAGQNQKEENGDDDEALRRVAVLAVPSYMAASDFMGFVGEETRENVSHFRMIRTGKANRYMVLMMFRTKEGAREFVRRFNGKVFNSMEPENCHVVFIKSIEFTSPSTTRNPTSTSPTSSNFPANLSNDPFSPHPTQSSSIASTTTSARPTLRQPTILQAQPPPPPPQPPTSTTLSTKPVPPPTPSLLELPTCPVCLERMDETTGLLTILCQHVFHCACLSKWKDSSCPVCRYSQAGAVGRQGQEGDEETEEVCNVCGAESNLWICLICGHIGCGRYDDAHAFKHYEETGHTYAMDVETQRVWDYAGDGYVHRLIQNKSDGKLVELPSALSSSRTTNPNADGNDYVPREKLENIGLEYTYLLTSQLESQRTYFEEKIAQAADKAASATRESTESTTLLAKLTAELEELKARHEVLTRETLPQLTREKERAERKAEKMAEMARRLEKEWREEKSMNGSLLEKVEFLTKRDEEGRRLTEELKDQVRDLMFFLEARDKLKEGGEEVVEGTVTVAEAPPQQGGSKKKKGKGKR